MVLPAQKASDISSEINKPRWLIEDLWLDEGVGFIGGEPKTCKTFMTLEMAVAVASGKLCLRHYEVKSPGSVLIFSAEDSSIIIKRRLSTICSASKVHLAELDINLITTPVLRIDTQDGQTALRRTIEQYKPKLLVLDPFIRLHRIDENLSSEVSPILAYLRELQKIHSTAIAVVHHARKRSGNSRAGQSLRGSSEFHAWYDSHLYLSRAGEHMLRLDVEHRSEPSKDNISLKICISDESVFLEKSTNSTQNEIIETGSKSESLSIKERIITFLNNMDSPQSLNTIRDFCKTRKITVSQELSQLINMGAVKRHDFGYMLANNN